MKISFGGSSWSKLHTLTVFLLCACVSSPRVLAEQIQATYRLGGAFVHMDSDNPWGATNSKYVNYQMLFTFMLPTSEDRYATDTQMSEWSTAVEATITANGVSVDYSGLATVGLRTNYSSNPAAYDRTAWIRLPDSFFVTLTNDRPFAGFVDDSVDNLLHLNGNAYMGTAYGYNDLDRLSLVSVVSVPDSGATVLLLGLAFAVLAGVRRCFA